MISSDKERIAKMADARKTSDELSKVAYYFHHLQTIGYHGDVPKYREYERICFDALALLKEQEETKTIICPKCGDEIEIKWSLLIKPDMEAIAKRDAFLSDKNGKKLNDAMQSLLGEKIDFGKGALG